MSVEVTINIDTNKIINKMNTGISDAIRELTPKLLAYAKSHHRYNDISGNLTNSTSISQMKTGLTLYASMEYGSYIHNGFKTWSPDPWLKETLENNKRLIDETIKKHIGKSTK